MEARFAEDSTAFWRDVDAIEKESDGLLCFAARDLQTGATLRRNADLRCQTASVIKLPILVHVGMSVEEGALDWTEPLTLTNEEKVDGSGILTQLTAGLTLSMRDICVLMTVLSDNTATNMVIERLGVGPINQRMRDLGLPVTTCFRKSYHEDTPESAPYGLGVTTPEEMLQLMESVATRQLGRGPMCDQLVGILKAQQYRDCIPRLLPAEWTYAGKTGAIDAARNDVGLIVTDTGERYVLALFCQGLKAVLWTADNPGMVALARLARRILA